MNNGMQTELKKLDLLGQQAANGLWKIWITTSSIPIGIVGVNSYYDTVVTTNIQLPVVQS